MRKGRMKGEPTARLAILLRQAMEARQPPLTSTDLWELLRAYRVTVSTRYIRKLLSGSVASPNTRVLRGLQEVLSIPDGDMWRAYVGLEPAAREEAVSVEDQIFLKSYLDHGPRARQLWREVVTAIDHHITEVAEEACPNCGTADGALSPATRWMILTQHVTALAEEHAGRLSKDMIRRRIRGLSKDEVDSLWEWWQVNRHSIDTRDEIDRLADEAPD